MTRCLFFGVSWRFQVCRSESTIVSAMKDGTLATAMQAAIEHDPDRLMKLIAEFNRMLQEKEQRLKAHRQTKVQSAA